MFSKYFLHFKFIENSSWRKKKFGNFFGNFTLNQLACFQHMKVRGNTEGKDLSYPLFSWVRVLLKSPLTWRIHLLSRLGIVSCRFLEVFFGWFFTRCTDKISVGGNQQNIKHRSVLGVKNLPVSHPGTPLGWIRDASSLQNLSEHHHQSSPRDVLFVPSPWLES